MSEVPEDSDQSRRGGAPGPECSAFRSLVELAGVWAIAVAWPVFQGATSGPDAFTRSRAGVGDLLLFALLVMFVVPVALWILERIASRISPRAGQTVRAVLIGLLLGAVAWQGAFQLGAGSVLASMVFLAAAALITVAYLRSEFMKSMAGLLGFAVPVVLIGLFISAPAQAVLSGQGEVPEGTANGTPVVVVAFDEFPLASIENRDGRIDPRFKTFSSLSAEATWYPQTLSVADETTAALPAILAGKRDGLEDPPTSGSNPESIFSLLAGAGYEVNADEAVTDLCPHEVCAERGSTRSRVSRLILNGVDNARTLPGGLVDKATEPLTDQANKLSPRPPKVVNQFVESLEPGRDQLDFVHVMLPHVPWRYLPEGQEFEAPLAPGLDLDGGDQSIPWQSPQGEINSAFQREQLQLLFTDRLLGRIVERMKKTGLWDEAMFVVVADHGASFQHGLMRRHANEANSGWILPVPLFIKYPDRKSGRIDRRPAETLDILPTVLDVTGYEPVPDLEGSSLLGPPESRPEVTVESTAEGQITLDRTEVERRMKLAVQLRNRVFADGSPWAMAGHPDLIGKPAASVPELKPVEADFDDPWPNAIVDPDTNTLPSYVTGKLADPADAGKPLVIVLNGHIAGTLRSYGPDRNFAFTLPADLFIGAKSNVKLLTYREGE